MWFNKKVLLAALAAISVPAFGTIQFVSSPFANNDQVFWSQLGADSTSVPQDFSATSTDGIGISGVFNGTGGGTVLVIPGSWPATAGSFNSGDSLIWTGDAFGNNNGPLTLTFGSAVNEAGLWIQADAAGTFTGEVTVFEGGTSSVFTLASDGSGDPIFLGGKDSTNGALITKVVLQLTQCGNGTCTATQLNDFAVDTLFLTDSGGGAPEPATTFLIGTGLAAIAWAVRRQSLKSRRTL
jgi:hypothetical protein